MQSSRRLIGTLVRIGSDCNANVGSRSYYTNRQNKATLYSKISPLGNPSVSLSTELDEWVDKGNKVRVAELERIIHDLRKRRRYSQALQVSEWMNNKGVCLFSPVQHAVKLDLIGRVHGFLSAESYFNELKDEEKTDKTYGALLHCYVRQNQTDKSLSHLEKMKEMGFPLSSLTYNNIMCLYTNVGQSEKVPDVLAMMKNNGISPDNYSYRICINSYGVRSDIGGVEKVLKEMESQSHIVMDWNTYSVVANFYIKADLKEKAISILKKAEAILDKNDGLGYNHLITLYARLEDKANVLRLWNLEKSACKRCINRDYINMLESLVKLGELEEAEKLLEEWNSSDNCYDSRVPNIVIAGYLDRRLYEKAKEILEELMKEGKASKPDSWLRVASGYLDKNEMEKAVESMKTAHSLHVDGEKWKPSPKVISDVFRLLGDKGSINDVETFVSLLRPVIVINRTMYHAMIRAYIRGGKEVNELLDRMKADNIDQDEETMKILGQKENTI